MVGQFYLGQRGSLDSGSGLDDVCIFVSDQGEIAVYQGTDPASASTWSLVGVYEIGKPLNKHASFGAGGDLAILTEDGIIPVSEALRKGPCSPSSQCLDLSNRGRMESRCGGRYGVLSNIRNVMAGRYNAFSRNA